LGSSNELVSRFAVPTYRQRHRVAIVFFGGILARQLVRSVAEKSPGVHNFAIRSQAAGRIENLMVIPGNFEDQS
jgi:hypothetical protein